MTDNLRAATWRAWDNRRAVIIYFQARAREEEVCFQIRTRVAIISSFWEMPTWQGGRWFRFAEQRGDRQYAIALEGGWFLDRPFLVGLELDTDDDPQDGLAELNPWDKTGVRWQTAYTEFPEPLEAQRAKVAGG